MQIAQNIARSMREKLQSIRRYINPKQHTSYHAALPIALQERKLIKCTTRSRWRYLVNSERFEFRPTYNYTVKTDDPFFPIADARQRKEKYNRT